MAFTARMITDAADLLAAKKLVYQVYCEELGWLPAPGNPSGLRVEQHPQKGPYLEDNFSDHSRWIGIYERADLVATARFLNPSQNGLEFHLYHSQSTGLESPIAECVEVNRVAIAKEYQRSEMLAFLILSIVDQLRVWDVSCLITTVSFPEPGDLCLKLGLEKTRIPDFKYTAADPSPVSVLQLMLRNRLKVERLRNICEHIMGPAFSGISLKKVVGGGL